MAILQSGRAAPDNALQQAFDRLIPSRPLRSVGVNATEPVRSVARALLFVVAIAGTVGCARDPDHLADLRENQSKWLEANLASYQFEIERHSHVLYHKAILVTVSGEMETVLYADGTAVNPREREIWFVGGVPTLFEDIEALLSHKPDRVEIEYDSDYGYPVRIFSDSRRGAIDDEVTILIKEFQTP